ncbi:unnamed protein product [Pleuronectes platessa]|uniref:Uncharacterized protein n=1 Tax=Pleuronectes platessa TaxID=8262 RepID=A0A9N7YB37_PLEPL|nr:unnamed protein product [Pleuronectes platessa]
MKATSDMTPSKMPHRDGPRSLEHDACDENTRVPLLSAAPVCTTPHKSCNCQLRLVMLQVSECPGMLSSCQSDRDRGWVLQELYIEDQGEMGDRGSRGMCSCAVSDGFLSLGLQHGARLVAVSSRWMTSHPAPSDNNPSNHHNRCQFKKQEHLYAVAPRAHVWDHMSRCTPSSLYMVRGMEVTLKAQGLDNVSKARSSQQVEVQTGPTPEAPREGSDGCRLQAWPKFDPH